MPATFLLDASPSGSSLTEGDFVSDHPKFPPATSRPRMLSEVGVCERSCRENHSPTCGGLNKTFACESLDSLCQVSCDGCCEPRGDLEPGAVAGIVIGSLWGLCFLIQLFFRCRSQRKVKKIVANMREKNPEVSLDTEQDIEAHLDPKGQRWMKKKKRWAFDYLSLPFPCLPVAFPGLHVYLKTAIAASVADILYRCRDCIAVFTNACTECRSHAVAVQNSVNTAKGKARATVCVHPVPCARVRIATAAPTTPCTYNTDLLHRHPSRTGVLGQAGGRPLQATHQKGLVGCAPANSLDRHGRCREGV